MNKFELIRSLIPKTNGKDMTLLDVGCRGCELRDYVTDLVQYKGVDLFQNDNGNVDFVLNVEEGLPFPDNSYDFVVALDLVEHLNNFQGGLEELYRVARKSLMVMLPNIAHIVFRKEFVLRGRLGAKYDLKYGMGKDRHRWLTTIPQIDDYMRRFAEDKKVNIKIVWFNDSRKKILFGNLAKFVGLSPSWWVWASLYIVSKAEMRLSMERS
jgi:hypothetical protein